MIVDPISDLTGETKKRRAWSHAEVALNDWNAILLATASR